MIPSQVKLADHFTVFQEQAQSLNVLISEVLVFGSDHVWTVDTPGFESRLEAVSYLGIAIELDFDYRLEVRSVNLRLLLLQL